MSTNQNRLNPIFSDVLFSSELVFCSGQAESTFAFACLRYVMDDCYLFAFAFGDASVAGWLVKVKTTSGNVEHVAEYIVVTSDWMKASDIARQAALADTGDGRIINTRVLREASEAEVEGVPEGQAKQRRSRR